MFTNNWQVSGKAGYVLWRAVFCILNLNYSECSLKSYLKLIRWLFELFCILRIFNSSKCSLLKLPTSWKICDVKTLKASFFFPPVGELTFPHLFCLNVYQWFCAMFVQTRSSHLLQIVRNPVLNVWNTLWEMQMYLIEHFWGRTPKKWSCLYWTDHHPHLACGSEKVCFNKLTLGDYRKW